MKGVSDALTPAGAGTHRVLTSWTAFARHADLPCETCWPAAYAVLRGLRVPGELLDRCCEPGQDLLRAWTEACGDLVDHLLALR